MDIFQILIYLKKHMDILLQTIIWIFIKNKVIKNSHFLVVISWQNLTIYLLYFLNNEKVPVAYSHPPHSCGELGDSLGPQTRMDPTEGAFGPLSNFPIGLLGESYKMR